MKSSRLRRTSDIIRPLFSWQQFAYSIWPRRAIAPSR